MWRRSFVATTLALGDSVDDALAAMAGGDGAATGPHGERTARSAPHVASTLGPGSASELVAQLRAPHRATRAAALAKAVHEIVLRIDEGTLR